MSLGRNLKEWLSGSFIPNFLAKHSSPINQHHGESEQTAADMYQVDVVGTSPTLIQLRLRTGPEFPGYARKGVFAANKKADLPRTSNTK